MWKFPKNLRKGCVLIRYPEWFLFAFLVSLISCAPKAPRIQPQIPQVAPAANLNLASNPSFDKGYEEYQKGNMQKARSMYAKSLKEHPEFYPANLAMAYTYLSEQNWDLGERYIRKALEINPDYAQAHFELAHIYETRQEYENALSELNEVARVNSEYPSLAQSQNLMKLKATETHLEEGRRLAEQNPEAALRHLKAAHDLAPEVAQIPVEIAEILLKSGNCREAVSYLAIAVQKMPDDLSIKKQYAECLVDLEEYQQALVQFQEIEQLQPDDPEIKRKIKEIKREVFEHSLPPEYQSIPATPEISRGQFSAYLFLNLDYLDRFQSQDSAIIVDAINHWAQKYIQRAVNLGILDAFPNRTFQPNLPISKLELAKAASRVLELFEAGGKVIPQTAVEIPDVPEGNIYYRMIVKSVSAGMISMDADGRFHPHRKVSGAEAISLVNRLRTVVEGS